MRAFISDDARVEARAKTACILLVLRPIPAPVRPPVAFADEDADGYDPRDAEFLSQDPLEDMDCVAGLFE